MDPIAREMFRGDTLFFASQAWQHPTSKQIVALPQGAPPPPGFASYDLTGAKLVFTLKNNYADADQQNIAQLDTAALGGVVIVAATSGQYTVTLPPLATRALPDTRVTLLWDVQVKDAAGRIFTLEYGKLTVDPDVTRAIA